MVGICELLGEGESFFFEAVGFYFFFEECFVELFHFVSECIDFCFFVGLVVLFFSIVF